MKHTNGSFEWGPILEDGRKVAKRRRLAKTIAESVDGITFREDEEMMTMTGTSSSSQLKDEEEFSFSSVQLRIKEQLREVSDDIAKLFREKENGIETTHSALSSNRRANVTKASKMALRGISSNYAWRALHVKAMMMKI